MKKKIGRTVVGVTTVGLCERKNSTLRKKKPHLLARTSVGRGTWPVLAGGGEHPPPQLPRHLLQVTRDPLTCDPVTRDPEGREACDPQLAVPRLVRPDCSCISLI
jgi:hypothetical protein